jgi:hypothetical protein
MISRYNTSGYWGLQMPQGAPELPQGAPELPQGAPELPQGAPELPQGAPELPQGASLTKRRKALLKGTIITTDLINYINKTE